MTTSYCCPPKATLVEVKVLAAKEEVARADCGARCTAKDDNIIISMTVVVKERRRKQEVPK